MEERQETICIPSDTELLRQMDPEFKISIIKRLKEIREDVKSVKKN